jgi:methylenetetrahydrofolate reductase (NADPH)
MMSNASDNDQLVAESAERLARRPGPEFTPLGRELSVSFEFFPPNTEQMEAKLWHCVERLAPLGPRFVSVTYGAGGTTRERTHATVRRIVEETDLTPAAHLTCVSATRAEVDDVARAYAAAGVRHIVALRGDPPGADQRFVPHPGGYRNAADLVAGLREVGDFELSVAAYPETHPDAVSAEADLDNLKRKVEAGASRAITQFFFDTDDFLRFVDRARAAGIGVPIVPGILPVTNFARVREFAARCGTSVPGWLAELFDGLDDAPDVRQLVAATTAAEQCKRLCEQGVTDFHFYTLNRAELSLAICRILGISPAPSTDSESRTTGERHAP